MSSRNDTVITTILLGPPGCGKGSCAYELMKRKTFVHLSTGDILRKVITSGSDQGCYINDIVKSGKLVPDDVVVGLIEAEMVQHTHEPGFLFDGFPRTVAQAISLDALLTKYGMEVTKAIQLDVPDEVLLGRIVGRMVHLPSGRVYHKTNNPPKEPMKDDVTGEPLTIRNDDNEDTLKERIREYEGKTKPVVDYYLQQGKLVKINGNMSINDVVSKVEKVLGII